MSTLGLISKKCLILKNYNENIYVKYLLFFFFFCHQYYNLKKIYFNFPRLTHVNIVINQNLNP